MTDGPIDLGARRPDPLPDLEQIADWIVADLAESHPIGNLGGLTPAELDAVGNLEGLTPADLEALVLVLAGRVAQLERRGE